jgi:hypothetical protein
LKQETPFYRSRSEKGEKDEKSERAEKGEKQEKGEKGETDEKHEAKDNPIIGGLVLLWLGVSLLLANSGYFYWIEWWAYFLLGLGAILILSAFLVYIQVDRWDPAIGYLFGGIVLLFIGVSNIYGVENWWAFIIIAVGLYVIFQTLRQRSRNPVPI